MSLLAKQKPSSARPPINKNRQSSALTDFPPTSISLHHHSPFKLERQKLYPSPMQKGELKNCATSFFKPCRTT